MCIPIISPYICWFCYVCLVKSSHFPPPGHGLARLGRRGGSVAAGGEGADATVSFEHE